MYPAHEFGLLLNVWFNSDVYPNPKMQAHSPSRAALLAKHHYRMRSLCQYVLLRAPARSATLVLVPKHVDLSSVYVDDYMQCLLEPSSVSYF